MENSDRPFHTLEEQVNLLKGKGIILKEPSVVAIDRKTGNILATGNEAKDMLRKNTRTNKGG